MSKFRWINEDIPLTGPLTVVLKNTIKEAEEMDLKGDREYFCIADALDNIGKSLVTSGKWTKNDWDNLCKHFPTDVF